jgi:hypothetical protein
VSVLVGARFAPNIPLAQKFFCTHLIVLRGDEAQVKACFGPFGQLLILTQDRCTVCIECTIGSKIILDAPDGTPR